MGTMCTKILFCTYTVSTWGARLNGHHGAPKYFSLYTHMTSSLKVACLAIVEKPREQQKEEAAQLLWTLVSPCTESHCYSLRLLQGSSIPSFLPRFCGRLLPQRGGRRATNTWHQPQKQFGWLDFFLLQMNSSWIFKVSTSSTSCWRIFSLQEKTALEWKLFTPASEYFFFFLRTFHFGCFCMYPAACSFFDISNSNSQYPIFRYWRKSLDKNNSRLPPSNIGRAGCLLYISLIWMQGRWSAMTVMFAQADPSLPATTYGALYVVCRVWYFHVVSLVYVYGWPLCSWTK